MKRNSIIFIKACIFLFLFCVKIYQAPLFAQKVQFSSKSQIALTDNYTTIFEKEMISSFPLKNAFNSTALINNVKVSRNPEQVLITKDDKYAFVRCFLGNTVELIDIKEGKLIKSFSIPSPQDIALSNDEKKLFVASLTKTPQISSSVQDVCATTVFYPSNSVFTIIDIERQVIEKTMTIEMETIRQIMNSSDNNIVFLSESKGIIELNTKDGSVSRKWIFNDRRQVNTAKIDLNNNQIFISDYTDSLKVLDLNNGQFLSKPFYTDGTTGISSSYIGMDAVSNRVFYAGKNEILVFNASSLELITKVKCDFSLLNVLPIPDKNIIYVSGFGYTALELDYKTLSINRTLEQKMYSMVYNSEKNKIYCLKEGTPFGWLSSSPPFYLDITEYDRNTNKFTQYTTTNHEYSCCFGRSLAMTSNGNIIIATNSPENTISILNSSIPTILTTNPDSNPNLDISPNPTSDLLKVSINDVLSSNYSVELSDINGRTLQCEKKDKNDCKFYINMSHYINGIYILTFTNESWHYKTKVIKH